MLHQVNYQELKSLILQYPFATNLRYLLLIKSLLDGRQEYDRHLVLASLSSLDRGKLQQIVKQYSYFTKKEDNFTISDEFLELKDLSTLEEVLETGPSEQPTPQSAAIAPPVQGNELEFLDDLPEEPTAAPTEEPVSIASLEELIHESATDEQPSASTDTLDQLFQMDKPLVNRPRESDLEDLEIEESLDGLFDDLKEEEERNASKLEEINKEMAEKGFAPEQITTEPEGPTHEPSDVTTEAKSPEIDISPSLSLEETIQALAKQTSADEKALASMDKFATDVEDEASGPEGQTPDATDVPLEITNDDEGNLPTEPQPGPAPTPKSTFRSYRRQFQPKRPGLLSGEVKALAKEENKEATAPILPEPPLEEGYKEPENVAKDMAAQSVNEDSTIATETLANILARQGHFDKAIKMYEKLSLQFPEKSDTFAAKIQELKNK